MEEENPIEYVDEEAIKVIMDSITEELREKLSEEDIGIIIDLKYKYLENINIISDSGRETFVTYTADVDSDAMDEFVITNAVTHDIYISDDELQDIWEGDLAYLEMKGLLGDLPLEEMN